MAVATVRIEAREVEHRFAAGRGLLPATFTHEGTGCIAILGPNGAGKSTLIRMMTTLMPITSGKVIVAGHEFVAPLLSVTVSVTEVIPRA